MPSQDDDFYVQRTIMLPKTSKLTEEVIQQLDHILDFAAADEYREALIEIYHTYICRECDSLPYNFRDVADRMYFLIDFLRKASEEMNGVGGSPK
jgi:hypothetical protein